ncbi:MAG: hypothetical protein E7161_03055 [Firmicutes bacterium]|nr:hypothetical protein [Bacillota bacterium]
MEIKDILKDVKIVGIVSNYQTNLKIEGKVKDLKIKNISSALKMVGLGVNSLEKSISDLSISELWKLELASKLDNDVIIIGDIYNSLIYKDREYMKKLFVKLSNDYQKKIVIIDNNINSFIGVVKKIFVIRDKKIVYETGNFFDQELYKYVKMPKIIDFIKYVNRDNNRLEKTTDIYELIKDIYRRVS